MSEETTPTKPLTPPDAAAPCSVEAMPQWTPRVKKMLALAVKTAKEYGITYVGSEHLLAGIAREKEGYAARVLAEKGITLEWLIQDYGWKTMEELTEERERRELARLKEKYEPQNATSIATP